MKIDPHRDQPLLTAGPAPEEAAATLVLVHGRGGTADDILTIHRKLAIDGLAAVAPQAAGNTWYPLSFLAPLEDNQPHLDSALARLGSIVDDLIARGVPSERIAFFGFSQGACLALEFVARHPRAYGGVMGICGGLIGPPGTPRDYAGSLFGARVFLGASDPDPHIPFERVTETAATLSRMTASVELRRYPGLPHALNGDELDACRSLLTALVSTSRRPPTA